MVLSGKDRIIKCLMENYIQIKTHTKTSKPVFHYGDLNKSSKKKAMLQRGK
jgi:hypothetical protein